MLAPMALVKRAGGSGTGFYSNGLAAGAPTVEPQRASRPTPTITETLAPPQDTTPAPAYRPTKREQVRNGRIILDVLAHTVREGTDAELSMLYPDALEFFGADSPHFQGACQGQAGAATHYERTVAGGRFSS